MEQNELDILVRFLIDQATKGKFNADINDIAANMKKMESLTADDLFKLNEADLDKLLDAQRKQIEAEQDKQDAIRETMQMAQTEARLLRATANAIQDDVLKFQIARYNQISQQIGGISTAALGIGTGIVGGIFAFAAKYVKDAKEATQVTREWNAAQESLKQSGQRVGAVLAETALPLLKTAARLASQAADFISSNPEIVQAALNVGLITASLGALGIAVSKGIKLYADALYLSTIPTQMAAARLQAEAANKQLLAAQMRGQLAGVGPVAGAGTTAAGGAAGAGLFTTLATLIASAIGGALIGDKIGDAIARRIDPNANDWGFKDYVLAFKQYAAVYAFTAAKTLLGQEKALQVFRAVANFLGLRQDKAEAQAPAAPAGVAGSPAMDQVLDAYKKYKEDDLKLVQEHYAQRRQIEQESQNAILSSVQKFDEAVYSANRQRSNSLAQAEKQFAENERSARVQYETERAQTLRDSEIQIQDIRRQSLENLRKLEQEHAGRVDELARSRDALGLVKEKRAYLLARAEENRNTTQEIQQRRRDTVIRLADQAKAFEQERAQRLLDYQNRVAEINAQASQRISELRDQHEAELRQIRIDRISKLKELDAQFADERKRRNQQLIATIRDLDASLLGEQNLRKRYQDAMIADLDRFLTAYKNGLSTLANEKPSARARGGYATYGTYILGDSTGGGRGRPEYVLSAGTTEALERALGGSLSQDRILQLAALMGRGGMGNQIQYNDNRRIDSRVSASERNMMMNETIEAVNEVFSNLPRK